MRDSILTRILAATTLLSGMGLATETHAQSLAVGEATLRFEAIGAVSYYTNPYLRDKAFEEFFPIEDSLAFILDPTVVLEMGDDESRYQISGDAGITVRRFESIDELDAEDLHLDFEAVYRGDKSRWTLNASTAEISLPEHHTRRATTLPQSDRTTFNWNGSYRYSTRTRLAGGVNFYDRSFSDTEEFDYSNWSSFSVPVRFYYQMTEKMELGGGVRYRNRDQERFDAPSDLAWHLALDGELSSKVTADVKIGFIDEKSSAINSSTDGDLFLSARLNWQATQDSSVTLLGESDSYSTGINDSVLRESIRLSSNWRVSTKLAAEASVSYTKENFDNTNRTDKVSELSVALNYVPQDSPLFSTASISHEKSDSNLTGLDYKSFVINWTTGWRF